MKRLGWVWAVRSVGVACAVMSGAHTAQAVEVGPAARLGFGVASGRLPEEYELDVESPGAATHIDHHAAQRSTHLTLHADAGVALRFRPVIGIFPHLALDYTAPHAVEHTLLAGGSRYILRGNQSVLSIGIGNEVRFLRGRLTALASGSVSHVFLPIRLHADGVISHVDASKTYACGRLAVGTRLLADAGLNAGLQLFGDLWMPGYARLGLMLSGDWDGSF